MLRAGRESAGPLVVARIGDNLRQRWSKRRRCGMSAMTCQRCKAAHLRPNQKCGVAWVRRAPLHPSLVARPRTHPRAGWMGYLRWAWRLGLQIRRPRSEGSGLRSQPTLGARSCGRADRSRRCCAADCTRWQRKACSAQCASSFIRSSYAIVNLLAVGGSLRHLAHEKLAALFWPIATLRACPPRRSSCSFGRQKTTNSQLKKMPLSS